MLGSELTICRFINFRIFYKDVRFVLPLLKLEDALKKNIAFEVSFSLLLCGVLRSLLMHVHVHVYIFEQSITY